MRRRRTRRWSPDNAVVPLQCGLVGHRLGDVALAGSPLADDQPVLPLRDEFESVQFEAGRPPCLWPRTLMARWRITR